MNQPGLLPTARVLLVDDSPELLSAWTRLLSREHDLEVVGALESLSGLMDAVRTLRPHVLVLDVSVGQGDGIALIPELKLIAPKMRVILYSGRTDPAVLDRVRAEGGAAFIGKHHEPQRLIDAIREQAREVLT